MKSFKALSIVICFPLIIITLFILRFYEQDYRFNSAKLFVDQCIDSGKYDWTLGCLDPNQSNYLIVESTYATIRNNLIENSGLLILFIPLIIIFGAIITRSTLKKDNK